MRCPKRNFHSVGRRRPDRNTVRLALPDLLRTSASIVRQQITAHTLIPLIPVQTTPPSPPPSASSAAATKPPATPPLTWRSDLQIYARPKILQGGTVLKIPVQTIPSPSPSSILPPSYIKFPTPPTERPPATAPLLPVRVIDLSPPTMIPSECEASDHLCRQTRRNW